ncbi:DUF2505 domain-containing protein [Schaalia turicensis]|uniref:DUF2505 domain-containing protein n=1 Tax=Schaalia turicensis TaxID=131111 RepID=UPI0018981774|nr:DUF2505 domain-containing protein [Schaalia turicensis]
MEFSKSLTYPVPLANFQAMSVDPDFVRGRFAHFCPDLQVENFASGVRAHGSVDSGILPAQVRQMIRGELRLAFSEEFVHEATLTATTQMSFEVAPVRVTMTSHFSGSSKTLRQVEGEVKVAIPFFGARIESEVLKHVDEILDEELKLASGWHQRGSNED